MENLLQNIASGLAACVGRVSADRRLTYTRHK